MPKFSALFSILLFAYFFYGQDAQAAVEDCVEDGGFAECVAFEELPCRVDSILGNYLIASQHGLFEWLNHSIGCQAIPEFVAETTPLQIKNYTRLYDRATYEQYDRSWETVAQYYYAHPGWPDMWLGYIFKRSCPVGFSPRTRSDGSYECFRLPILSCSLFGNPIEAISGEKRQRETDYANGTPLRFERLYASQGFRATGAPEAHPGQFGNYVWKSNFDLHLYPESGTSAITATLVTPQAVIYFDSLGKEVHNRNTSSSTLVQTAAGWERRLDDGSVEHFDPTGQFISKVFRGGYTWDLAYTANGQLDTVTDSYARSIRFEYTTGGALSGFYDPGNALTTYAYDSFGRLTDVTFPDGSTRSYLYNESAYSAQPLYNYLLTGIVDELGERFATYYYDKLGRATVTTHAANANRFALSYPSYPKGLTRVTTPLGALIELSYGKVAGTQRVLKTTQPCPVCGGTDAHSYTYDANGNIASKTDFNGNKTTYVYDLTRNLETSRTEAAGTPQARTITTQWHPDNRLPTRITEPGRVTEYDYDSAGNRIAMRIIADGQTRTWTYTVNPWGRRLTEDGPRTDVNDLTTYTYDGQGNLATLTNALGHLTRFTQYDAHGRLTRMEDPNGVVTTLSYDLRGRLLSTATDGQTTQYHYDAAGNLTGVTLPGTGRLTYHYDAAHRLIGIEDALGNGIDYTLNAMGSRTAESVYDPSNQLRRSQTQVYDSLNRLKQVLDAQSQVRAAYDYDPNGNVTTITDGRGNDTGYAYDPLDRLVQTLDAAMGITGYGYDARDNLTAVTDAENLTTTYTYNGFGDIVAQNSPDTGLSTYTVDPAGNRTSSTDARGITTTYTYDALDRLTAVQYPDSSLDVGYTYDQGTYGVGRLSGMSDESGVTSYTYDARGNRTAEHRPEGSVLYAYDGANRLIGMTYPSGRVVSYIRNTLGQVTRVETQYNGSTQVLANNITYQPFGSISSMAYGNGLQLTRSFDLDGRIDRQTIPGVMDWDFSYDGNSNITAIDDLLNAGATDQDFSYDPLDRITSAIGAYGTQGFSYDGIGNRLTQTWDGATDNYVYASNSHRLMGINSTVSDTRSYDAAGNTTTRKSQNLVYDDRSRLRQSGSVYYRYNGLGQRVAKDTGSAINEFLYHHDGQIIAETDADGAVQVEYLWLGDMPLGVVHHSATGAQLGYLHTEQLGTPRWVSDANGTVVWQWLSDPFGTSSPNEDPDGDDDTTDLNLRFPGQYFDNETGLNYNYFRDYDPSAGRYVESDPIGLAGGINTYAYALSNPIAWIDLDGAEPQKYEKPENPNRRKGAENRQQSGSRERNVGHPEGEEHSRRPKGGPRKGVGGGGTIGRSVGGIAGIVIPAMIEGACLEGRLACETCKLFGLPYAGEGRGWPLDPCAACPPEFDPTKLIPDA